MSFRKEEEEARKLTLARQEELLGTEREQMKQDAADRDLTKYGIKPEIKPQLPNSSNGVTKYAGNKRTNKRRKNKRHTMRKKRKIGRRRK